MKTVNIFKTWMVAGLALAAAGCEDFGNMNVDPNLPSSAPTSTLLTAAERSISDVIGATTPVLYVQYLSENQYTESSRYNTERFDFNGWYTGPLANLQKIVELNSDADTREAVAVDGGNNNQMAVARILKAYFFHMMTDRWGPLPYSGALKGSDGLTPSYDSQEEIYNDLFKELSEAVGQIDGGPGVVGDFLFNGDMDAWKRFGNTLRARMALRISGVNPAKAKTEFEAAMAGGLIASDVMYLYLNEINNENPWYTRFVTDNREDYSVSEPFMNYLKSVNDPRISAFAEEAGDFPGQYIGMPYGIQSAGDISNSSISYITSNIIYTQDAPLPVMTMAEVHFIMAEAKLLGWNVSGTAQAHYEAGVRASFDQWGVSGADAYLAGENVAWDDAKARERIGYQKWVALYMQGYEAWAEWRRTGFPMLTPAPDALNNSGQIPVRHGFPTSEFGLNGGNYDAGVVLLGGTDGLDTKLWWDVN
jgi:hypothetical protein